MAEKSFFMINQNLKEKSVFEFIKNINFNKESFDILYWLIYGEFSKENFLNLSDLEKSKILTNIFIEIMRRYKTFNEIERVFKDILQKIFRDINFNLIYGENNLNIRKQYFLALTQILKNLKQFYQKFEPLNTEELKKDIFNDFQIVFKKISSNETSIENFQEFRNNFIAFSRQDLSFLEIEQALNFLDSFLNCYKITNKDLDEDFRLAYLRIIRKRENLQELNKILEDFKIFVKNKFPKIYDLSKNNNLEKIESIFYKFYNIGMDTEKFFYVDKNKLIDYQLGINNLKEYLKNNYQKNILEYIYDKYWIHCFINGGLKELNEKKGRIYLNFKIENNLNFFQTIIDLFKDKGIKCQMKIPLGLKDSKNKNIKIFNFNRFDKLVIYFYANQANEVLELIEVIYSTYKNCFNREIPKFTLPLYNSKNEKMDGISFGEEPLPIKKKKYSFGTIRAKILTDLFLKWKEKNFEDDFDIFSTFQETCKQYNVDPFMPAFNKSGNYRGYLFFEELFIK